MKRLLFVAALVAAVGTFADTYYVDANQEAEGDGSERNPFKTLVKAMEGRTSGDIVYAAEGTYKDNSNGGYRVKVPAGVKLIASGRRSETIIEGEPAPDVATDANPWGCGQGAISGVYLAANAELHGFTVRNGHGTGYSKSATGGGVRGAAKATCIVYDCAVVDNFGGDGSGVYGVTAIRCDIGRNTGCRYANMQAADAYSCYLHGENTPDDGYAYGYGDGCTLNGCTIMPKGITGASGAGVNGSTCINCDTRNDRNSTKLWYTAYTGKGASSVANEGCFQVKAAEMAIDADYRPVFGSNRGIEKGSWFSYTNGASAKVLAYLDKDYAGKPRLSGLEMDMGCGECQMPEQDFAASLHPAPQFSVVSVSQTGVAPADGGKLIIVGGSEATWRWTVPPSTTVAVGYSLTVAVEGEATFAAYVGDAETPVCTVTAADGEIPFGYLCTGTHDVRLVVTGEGQATVSTVCCSDFGANNWYVNPAGDDDADGKSPATARRTLVGVMELAKKGDVVHAARGTYAEKFSPRYSNDHTTNRVIVATGVGLVADEGPSVTFIEGAKPSAGGNTGDDAIRCVVLDTDAWLKGFTLKNGATASYSSYQDYGGGVYYWGATSARACVFDCTFDNCSARRGGAGYGGVFIGCRFESTCSSGSDASSLYDCKLAINCVFKSQAYGKFTIVNCSAIGCEIKGNGAQQAYNTYFGTTGNGNMSKHDCRTVGVDLPTAVPLDDAGGPIFASPLIDVGDANHYRTNFPSAWAMFSGTAVNGAKRVCGTVIDVGAGEFAFSPAVVPESSGVTVAANGGSLTVTRNYRSEKLATGFTLNGAACEFPLDGSADSVTVPFTGALEDVLLKVSYVEANDYYVDQADGDDDNVGYAPRAAFRTLKKALAKVASGRTVFVAPGVYGDGSMTKDDCSFVAVVPANVKLVATGTKAECVIEGAADPTVEQDATPYGCGDNAVHCVYLNSGAEIHGFTVRNGHGKSWTDAKNAMSSGGIIGVGETTLVYDCTVTNNYGSCGTGVNNAVAVRSEIAWNWAGGEGGGANMRNGIAYNCYLHHECAPDYNYVYGYNGAKIVACTVLEEASDSQNAGVCSCTVWGSYVRHERNNSKMSCTYYGQKGTGATADDSCRLVTRAEMQFDDDLVPVYGANLGIDKGSWTDYTNGAPAVALKYLELDFNGNPRVANGAMDLGCCEFDYCGVYSQKLRAGRRVYTVTSASPAVTLAEDGVRLADGTSLAGTFMSEREGESRVVAEVTDGTLTVTLDGEMLTPVGGEYVFTCEPGTSHALAFAFAGEGLATIKRVRGPAIGALILVR